MVAKRRFIGSPAALIFLVFTFYLVFITQQQHWLGADVSIKAATVLPPSGTFVPADDLVTARSHHTATLLPGGQVLLTGGLSDSGNSVLSSAELYDPPTDTFVLTGNMTTARYSHTATLLPSGRVLIAGGVDGGNSSLSTAELYDPVTGNFSLTGNMVVQHAFHSATLLSNGKVLIAAGGSNATSWQSTAELYDPVVGTFSVTGNLGTPRYAHEGTLLADGRVLITGGNSFGSYTSDVELYDPVTSTFSLTGSLATARAAHRTSLLPNERVLVTGGNSNSGIELSSAELYDPITGNFLSGGSMTTPRYAHAATSLSNENILFTGGFIKPDVYLASAEIYDAISGTFTATGNMAVGRYAHTGTLLPDGRILIAGGWSTSGQTSTAELFTFTGSGVAEVYYLHRLSHVNNPSTLFLNNAAPSAPTTKFIDSGAISFSGGNLWKEIGAWPASPPPAAGTLTALGDFGVWVGLRNGDDQGTLFDLRAEVYKNGTLVASGETYCIENITRNPNLAKEVMVTISPFPGVSFNGTSDQLSVRILTRIGTNGTGGFCGGHSDAGGLRLYFDSISRPSSFEATFAP